MTIFDSFLDEVAKAINQETVSMPNYLTVSTDAALTSFDTSDTSLSGAVGDFPAMTGSRTNEVVTYSGIRSGTSVLASTGEALTANAVINATTGKPLLLGVLTSGVTQTTNFDIEYIYEITVVRP